MYPTIIIILCALDKSLHERSHNDARMSSPAFATPLGRGILSDVSSASCEDTSKEAHGVSSKAFNHDAKDDVRTPGDAISLRLGGISHVASSSDDSSYISRPHGHGLETSC